MWMIANDKNGISSWELHRGIGVTQKTAWFMLQRIRRCRMSTIAEKPLDSGLRVDETFYIGQKARKHAQARSGKKITGTGGKDKANGCWRPFSVAARILSLCY